MIGGRRRQSRISIPGRLPSAARRLAGLLSETGQLLPEDHRAVPPEAMGRYDIGDHPLNSLQGRDRLAELASGWFTSHLVAQAAGTVPAG